MTPHENSIYKTVSLLTMLSRQIRPRNLTVEEKATLTITKQYLTDNDLTLSEFSNSLNTISKKGYIWHVIFFDHHLRSQLDAFISSPDYEKAMAQLQALDTKEFSDGFAHALKEDVKKILPKNAPLTDDDFDDLRSENTLFTKVITGGIEAYKKLRPDEIGHVILMPFRDIEDLYKRLGKGEKFEDIKDTKFWYDPTNFEFRIDGDVVSTSYQGKPNIEHEVLLRLVQDFQEGTIWYDEIENRSPRSLKDALMKFVDKHPRLKEVFTVHHDRLEFDIEAFK